MRNIEDTKEKLFDQAQRVLDCFNDIYYDLEQDERLPCEVFTDYDKRFLEAFGQLDELIKLIYFL